MTLNSSERPWQYFQTYWFLSFTSRNSEYGEEAVAAKSHQLGPTLCDPIDRSPPGSSVPGILQARILEWVAISFSNACMHAKLLQLCPTLCDPIDSSPPGSSVHRILARILEWAKNGYEMNTMYFKWITTIENLYCLQCSLLLLNIIIDFLFSFFGYLEKENFW